MIDKLPTTSDRIAWNLPYVGIFFLITALPFFAGTALAEVDDARSQSTMTWQQLPHFPDEAMVDSFIGVHQNERHKDQEVLILAGGHAFLNRIVDESTANNGSHFSDRINVLVKSDRDSTKYRWLEIQGQLPAPIASGVSVSTKQGLLCLGGELGEGESSKRRLSDDVFLLQWDSTTQKISLTREWENQGNKIDFPKLPLPTTAGCGVVVGDYLYFAGGETKNGTSRQFLRLNLKPTEEDSDLAWEWESLPSWDGPPRSHAIAVSQTNTFFLISGSTGKQSPVFTDAYCFNPASYARELGRAHANFDGLTILPSYANGWKRIADMPSSADAPRPLASSAGIDIGYDQIFVFSGPQSSPNGQQSTGGGVFEYTLTTDTWTSRKTSAGLGRGIASVVEWDDALIFSPTFPKDSGEIWSAALPKDTRSFGVLNWSVLITYLVALVVIGIYFSSRENSSDDFFLAGGRVPWWAAGLSVFGTMLSAITYLSIPARSYATNWSWSLINFGIPVIALIVAYIYLPRLLKIKTASAYEFLETRFHVSLRILASISFIIYQFGRMGIVLLLPALALSAVTGINIFMCIVMMGVLSTLYTAAGGIEAVIWTDVVQVVVLVGGAFAALFVISSSVDGGFSEILQTAAEHGKLDLVSNIHFHDLGWNRDGIVVLLLAAFFLNLIPYSSDQAVIQRYMTVKDEKEARRALWTSAAMSIPATILFFLVGTALWVFYRAHPLSMAPLEKPDQIFPWFIAQEMPAGLAGLVIAGVFAAAMSSLDSSMHSAATVLTTDFYERLWGQKDKKKSLRFARIATIVLGVLGTLSAMWLATVDVLFLWDLVQAIMGLFLGTVGGLFTLGMLTRRVGAVHAWCGAVVSILVLTYVQFWTDTHGLLNGAISVCTCVVVALVASLIMPNSRRLEHS